MSYYPPYKSSSNNVKVELDLTNYATKTDLKNITHVDGSSFASKTNVAALKTEVVIRELKIDNTLWATPAKIINLIDFKPEKLSIKTENNDNIDIKVHQVRNENGGFYLTIDNIKGYLNFINNISVLSMIFSNDNQKDKYHQVWKEIFKIVNDKNGELKIHEKIGLFDSDMITDKIIKITSITIVIKSLIEKNNKFYLELALNHCFYEI